MTKIILDAGHGLNTPGKRTPDGSMKEFEFNSIVANYVADILKKYECAVQFAHDPTGKVDIKLDKRTDDANRWNANVYVSIHANAASNDWTEAKGIETFVYTSKPKQSLELANKIQRNLIKATGRKDRGVKTADFHVLRETHMDAILVECGFMTNKEEAIQLKSVQYRLKCAGAIAEGLVEHYNLKPKTQPKTPVIPSKTVYKVQVGAYSNKENAKKVALELKTKGYAAIVTE